MYSFPGTFCQMKVMRERDNLMFCFNEVMKVTASSPRHIIRNKMKVHAPLPIVQLGFIITSSICLNGPRFPGMHSEGAFIS